MKNGKFQKMLTSKWGAKLSVLVVIFVLMAIFQRKFFLPSNWSSILRAIAVYGVMACGMLFVVLVGGMDLSMGSMGAVSASIVAMCVVNSGYAKGSFLIGLVIAVAVCVLFGALHALLATKLSMNPFVITLATKYILYGAVMLITSNVYIYIQEKESFLYKLGNSKLIGLPMPVIIFIVYALICMFVLNFTTFGRKLYAVGGNARASELIGIKAAPKKYLAFIISAVSAGFGGIILSTMNTVAGSGTTSGYEGNVLMAMVVGGVNLAGGEGTILDAVYGALLVGIINNIQVLIGIPSDYQEFVRGIIIIGAVILSTKVGKSGSTKAKKARKKAA